MPYERTPIHRRNPSPNTAGANRAAGCTVPASNNAVNSAITVNPPRYIQGSNSVALRKNQTTPRSPTTAKASSTSGAPLPVLRVSRHGDHTNASAAPMSMVDARVSVPKYTRDGSVYGV